MNVYATEGATANAASAAAVSFRSSDINVLSPPAADDTTMPTASATATLADWPIPPPLVWLGVPPTAEGATATADSATESGMHGASGASVKKETAPETRPCDTGLTQWLRNPIFRGPRS